MRIHIDMTVLTPCRAGLLIALALAACAPTMKTASLTAAASPATWKKVDPGFLGREASVYQGLEGDALACTLATNAPAGAEWLKVVTQADADKLSLGDLLGAVDGALRSVETMEEWELADVGWLVALGIQRHAGGSFAWDSEAQEVALTLPSGERLHPMRVIAEAREGRLALASLAPGGSAQGAATDCANVGTRDVLQRRSLMQDRRRRR